MLPRYTIVNGIAFIEGPFPVIKFIEIVSTRLNGFFSQNQLKTLGDLEMKISILAKQKGGNAVINFKYGQKSTFGKSLLGMDDVFWYGCGNIVYIDPSEFRMAVKNQSSL